MRLFGLTIPLRRKTDEEIVARIRKILRFYRRFRPFMAVMAVASLAMGGWALKMLIRIAQEIILEAPEGVASEFRLPGLTVWLLIGVMTPPLYHLLMVNCGGRLITAWQTRPDEILVRCWETVEQAGNRTPESRAARRLVTENTQPSVWSVGFRPHCSNAEYLSTIRRGLPARLRRRPFYLAAFIGMLLASFAAAFVLIAVADARIVTDEADHTPAVVQDSALLVAFLIGTMPGAMFASALQAAAFAVEPFRKQRLLVGCWDAAEKVKSDPPPQ